MHGTFVEIAVNGPWGVDLQPNMPTAPNAIIEDALAACELGASVVHFHAYDESGAQSTEHDLIARICEGIRKETDAILYPAIRYMPNSRAIQSDSGAHRYKHYTKLTEQGHADWLIVDPGSANLVIASDADLSEAGVDINTPRAVRHGAELAARLGLNPTMAIYEPGYLRLAALLDKTLAPVRTPIYRIMFTDQLTFGFPPKPYALRAYLDLYHDLGLNAPWMIGGLGVDLSDLIPPVVRAGGHVRVGLEDFLLGTTRSNTDLMKDAKARIEDAGSHTGTAADLRALMGTKPKG